jgi:PiT family inorganic phosphate transporter
MSRRLVTMTPATGFAAESVASSVLYLAAGVFGVPVSSTHTVIASIVGAGSTRGLRSVRWGVVRWVLLAALMTPVVTFAVAGMLVWLAAR